MPQIIQPQGNNSRNDNIIFQLGGAVIGGIAGYKGGGPGGALKGASVGAAAGNQAGNMFSQMNQNGDSGVSAQVPTNSASAMQRRQQELETDNLTALREAEVAAAQLPEQQRQRIVPTLAQARIMEQRRRGIT